MRRAAAIVAATAAAAAVVSCGSGPHRPDGFGEAVERIGDPSYAVLPPYDASLHYVGPAELVLADGRRLVVPTGTEVRGDPSLCRHLVPESVAPRFDPGRRGQRCFVQFAMLEGDTVGWLYLFRADEGEVRVAETAAVAAVDGQHLVLDDGFAIPLPDGAPAVDCPGARTVDDVVGETVTVVVDPQDGTVARVTCSGASTG